MIDLIVSVRKSSGWWPVARGERAGKISNFQSILFGILGGQKKFHKLPILNWRAENDYV